MEELMQGLCEFKCFPRSNTLFISEAKHASRQEKLEFLKKSKNVKITYVGAGSNSVTGKKDAI